MTNLYLTSDFIGIESGGGKVTHHELDAFKTLGSHEVWDRNFLESDGPDPWKWDNQSFTKSVIYSSGHLSSPDPFRLCHLYSGSFSRTIALLKSRGCKVSYTCAAHDKDKSRKEYLELGYTFDHMTHLIDPDLWRKYAEGYFLADVLIVPSSHSAEVMRRYGRDLGMKTDHIRIIPHGVDLPDEKTIKPPPKHFTLGYLGHCTTGDKGVRYLLEAWKKLNYRDATLVLAGKDSWTDFCKDMVYYYGGGNIQIKGWVKSPADFYNEISCYCQPSITEGFGLEVLETMAHKRPVLCSDGAGACDVVPEGWRFKAGDVDGLCQLIESFRSEPFRRGDVARYISEKYSWSRVKDQYLSVWKGLLG